MPPTFDHLTLAYDDWLFAQFYAALDDEDKAAELLEQIENHQDAAIKERRDATY